MRDPLWRDVRTDQILDVRLLDVAVRFETNSSKIFSVVTDFFGHWPSTESALSGSGVRIRMILDAGAPHGSGLTPIQYRMPSRERLLLYAGHSFGVAEIDAGEAYAYVAPDLMGRALDFSLGFVEALALALVTYRDRFPIHAAAVGEGDAGLLLMGASGSGKSSLAYAAGKAGLDVHGEDAAYVQLRPEFRVWGKPGPLRLVQEVAAAFPELSDRTPQLLPNGKQKVVVPIAVPTVPWMRRVGIVSLCRGAGPVRVTRLADAEVKNAVAVGAEPGFDLDGHISPTVVRELMAHGGWRLELAPDPAAAVPHLRAMLGEIKGS